MGTPTPQTWPNVTKYSDWGKSKHLVITLLQLYLITILYTVCYTRMRVHNLRV